MNLEIKDTNAAKIYRALILSAEALPQAKMLAFNRNYWHIDTACSNALEAIEKALEEES